VTMCGTVGGKKKAKWFSLFSYSNYPLFLMIDYKSIIVRNPNKRFGKPCVRQTRITVFDVLGWLANGMTIEEIIHDFPELTEDDIKACLAFAADREHKLLYAS
jgi:uncharacterized protein (DUF433 family)